MNPGSALAPGTPYARPARKSRWPARLDWVQSVSGLVPLSSQIAFLRRKMVSMAWK